MSTMAKPRYHFSLHRGKGRNRRKFTEAIRANRSCAGLNEDSQWTRHEHACCY
jgi:hypothetical protein